MKSLVSHNTANTFGNGAGDFSIQQAFRLRDGGQTMRTSTRPTIRPVSPGFIIQTNVGRDPEDPEDPDQVSPLSNRSPKSFRRIRTSGQQTSPRPKTMIDTTPEKDVPTLNHRSRTRTLEDLPIADKISPPYFGDFRARFRTPVPDVSDAHAGLDIDPHDPMSASEPIVSGNASSRSRSKSESSRSGGVQDSKRSLEHRHRLFKPPKRIASPVEKTPELMGGTLPSPIRLSNANRILELMKECGGRMEGDVEMRSRENGNWSFGHVLIEEQGSLVQKSMSTIKHFTSAQMLLPDLRRCRVRTSPETEGGPRYLIITVDRSSVSLHLQPVEEADFDGWLAALLFWQPVRARSGSSKTSRSRRGSLPMEPLPNGERRLSSEATFLKDAAIIKIGTVHLLQPGPSLTTAKARKGSTTRLVPPAGPRTWQCVSCVLRENGEFKLYTEAEVTVVSVIQLSELSRCAIQRLDSSVLDRAYCLAIYPNYSVGSTVLSLIHPIHIALDSNVLHEVWLVLMRSFAVPELYGPSSFGRMPDVETPPSATGTELATTPTTPTTPTTTRDMFRVERTIAVRIIEARLWPPRPRTGADGSTRQRSTKKDPSIGNYRAEILLDGHLRARTTLVSNSNNPFWRDDFEFADLPAATPNLSVRVLREPEPERAGVLASLMDGPNGSVGPPSPSAVVLEEVEGQEYYGKVDLHVDCLDPSEDNEGWWSLVNREDERVGEILLRTRAEESIVLMSHDYRALHELLLQSPSRLSAAIAETIPGKLPRLSGVLLNIFQVSGQADRFLMALIEDEIEGIQQHHQRQQLPQSPDGVRVPARFRARMGSTDLGRDRETTLAERGSSSAPQSNLLFRGNSLLTKCFELHMGRIGKQYLEETLSGSIRTIDAGDLDCEVDPARLASSSSLEPHWRHLMNSFRVVWNAVHGSAGRCPVELRRILRHVRYCAEARWGQWQSSVSYSSVSGFLFLRFFCPAILNPKLFGLLKAHPRARSQRTLTLVAKSLQGLANMSTFGAKEPWMEPMNHFLASRRPEFKAFIDEVCTLDPTETGSGRASPSLLPSYATPMTILARLPPTAREGFPSLPYLIDQSLQLATLSQLWLDADVQVDLGRAQRSPTASARESSLLQRFDEICRQLQDANRTRLAQAEREQGVALPVSALHPTLSSLVALEAGSKATRSPPGKAILARLPTPPLSSSPRSRSRSKRLSAQRWEGPRTESRKLSEDPIGGGNGSKSRTASLSGPSVAHSPSRSLSLVAVSPLGSPSQYSKHNHQHTTSQGLSSPSIDMTRQPPPLDPHTTSFPSPSPSPSDPSRISAHSSRRSSDSIIIYPLPQPVSARPPPNLLHHQRSPTYQHTEQAAKQQSHHTHSPSSPAFLSPRTTTPLPTSQLRPIESLAHHDSSPSVQQERRVPIQHASPPQPATVLHLFPPRTTRKPTGRIGARSHVIKKDKKALAKGNEREAAATRTVNGQSTPTLSDRHERGVASGTGMMIRGEEEVAGARAATAAFTMAHPEKSGGRLGIGSGRSSSQGTSQDDRSRRLAAGADGRGSGSRERRGRLGSGSGSVGGSGKEVTAGLASEKSGRFLGSLFRRDKGK